MTLLIAFAFSSACSQASLTNARSSPEDLGRDLLAALADRDASRMQALAINEDEFKDLVWPSLPAARPERNLPFSYVWMDLKQKSETHLGATLHAYGGRRYQLDGVKHSTTPREYVGFRVYQDVVFAVRDSTGVPRELTLCGSLIEMNGQWKVFSFVTDD